MPEVQFTNYQADVTSYELSEALLGILDPGRYRGYDTIVGYSAVGNQITYSLQHNVTGITKTLKGGGLDASPSGVVVTKQGIMIHNNSNIYISFEQNTNVNPVLYLVVLKHQYILQEGVNPSLIEVIKGTPSVNPILPTIPVTPELYTPIGQILAIGSAGSGYFNYAYTKYPPPLLGALNKYITSNSILGLDINNRLTAIVKQSGFNLPYGTTPGTLVEIGDVIRPNIVLVTDANGKLHSSDQLWGDEVGNGLLGLSTDVLAAALSSGVKAISPKNLGYVLNDIRPYSMDLGPWNMLGGTGYIDIALSSLNFIPTPQFSIESIYVKIYSDQYIERVKSLTDLGNGSIEWDNAIIRVRRTASGLFDSTAYNDASQNRGRMYITYKIS